ncbi:hypothetical protein CCOS2040_12480 [Streptomyces albidoflavus]|nr:hypothetical protein CCOS2040_12480 [Streptomyces albidoflavus]
MPWRVRIRWTVEAGKLRTGPIRAGPSLRPVRSRQARPRSWRACGAGSCVARLSGRGDRLRLRPASGEPTCGPWSGISPSQPRRARQADRTGRARPGSACHEPAAGRYGETRRPPCAVQLRHLHHTGGLHHDQGLTRVNNAASQYTQRLSRDSDRRRMYHHRKIGLSGYASTGARLNVPSTGKRDLELRDSLQPLGFPQPTQPGANSPGLQKSIRAHFTAAGHDVAATGRPTSRPALPPRNPRSHRGPERAASLGCTESTAGRPTSLAGTPLSLLSSKDFAGLFAFATWRHLT